MPSPTVDEYGYDVVSGRFRSLTTGQYVKTADVRALVLEQIDTDAQGLQALGQAVANGDASLQQLQDAMLSYTRDANLTMYTLGRGGINQMTVDDFGNVSNKLQSEYLFLDGFMQDIQDGKLSAAQIADRITLYGDSTWNAYMRGEQAAMLAAGFGEMRRRLDPAPDVEHCQPCIDLDGKDWQPIGSLPLPADGSTPCLVKDRCTVEYRINDARGRVVFVRAA